MPAKSGKNIKLFENHKVKIDIIWFILFHSILQIPNKQAHKQTRLTGIKKGITEMLLLSLFSIYIALVPLRYTRVWTVLQLLVLAITWLRAAPNY